MAENAKIEETRQNLPGIWMELHDSAEPDHCCGGIIAYRGLASDNVSAWTKACSFMAQNAKMEEINVTINVKISADFRSLTWVQALVRIQGLQGLSLQAKQHSDDEVSI